MKLLEDGSYEFPTPKGDGRIVFFKDQCTPFTYAIHLELPAGGGDAAGLKFIRDCISAMFNETDALILHGYIKEGNLASKQIASACKWLPKPEMDRGEHSYRYMTISRWIMKQGKAGLEKAEARRPKK